MLTRKIFDSGKRYISTCTSMPRRNIQNIESLQIIESKINVPEKQKKLQQRAPFLKNIFIGEFDKNFLVFPEPQSDERYKYFLKWMAPIENYMSSITSTKVNQASRGEAFRKMEEFGILRARIHKDYDGLGTLEVETLQILETLSSEPWLATSLVKNNIVPIDVISKYGSEEQKRKYLPKIGNGDLLPTICITEVSSGPNVRNIETTAKMSECGNFWILNGKKIFVTNGEDSNLFLVVARCAEHKNILEYESLSTFIVEDSYGGITCRDVINTVGQQEVHVCTVDFKDIHIPKENMIGEIGEGIKILTDVFAPGNNRTAGEAIGILRKFVSLLNKNILGRRHLDQSMHEFEAVQGIVAKITCSLYCMESVAYFTTAINDTYENQDLELEKAVMETYCANECVQQIYKGLQLIGVDSYLKDNPYIYLYKDALGLSIFDGGVIDEKIYIALLGLQHTGQNFHEHVLKTRNYLFHPTYLLKKMFSKASANLHLFEYLHPSFRLEADMLEEFVKKLRELSIFLLEQYGSEISSKQMLLERLADVAIEIYVLVAVLSRASRSYCIGVRNADLERHIAIVVALRTRNKIEMLERDILNGESYNGDAAMKLISEAVFQEKKYICQSPLTRTL